MIPGLVRSPREEIGYPFQYSLSSLVTQMVKNLPAMQEMPLVWETWVQSLGQEDPLEKEMAIDARILPWEIP